MAMIEEMAKEAIDKLEQYVKTCNPAAVKYASLSTSLTIALEPDTMNISEKGKQALSKIDTLGKDFANKCSCTKK
jgi:hypothetical protein